MQEFRTVSLWLESTSGTLTLCSAIAAFGLLIYLLYFRPRGRRILLSLRDACTRLEIVRDEAAFAQEFEDIDRDFREHEILGHGWREFVDTLVAPKPDDLRQVFKSSREAAEYFAAADIVEGQVNLRFVHAVPGYLTGGGILGTFVGLVAGIYLASAGLASSDIQKTRDALSPLLSGAALAFWTSIVGLASSILFSIAEKNLLHMIDQQVGRWNAGLDKRLKRVTPEQLAADQVHEAARQTLQLERFNTDLAVSIAQALESRLSQSFTPKLNQMIVGLDQIRGQQAQFSQNVLEEVASRISTSVSGAAGVEMRQMAETMQSLVQILRESAGALRSSQAESTQAVADVIRRMESTFGQSAANLSTETSKSIERVVQYMDAAGAAASEQLTSAGANVSSTLAQAAERLTAILEQAGSGAAGRLEQAGGRLVSGLEEASTKAASHLENAGEQTAERLLEAGAAAARSLTGAGELVNSAATRFSGVAGALEQLHARHVAALESVQSLTRDLTSLHGAFALSVQPLSQGVNGLSAASAALAERIRESAEFERALIRAAEDTKTAQVFMQQAWSAYESRFADLDASVETMFKEINRGLETYSGSVRDFVGGIDKHFAKSIADLAGVINELDHTVEEFGRMTVGGARR